MGGLQLTFSVLNRAVGTPLVAGGGLQNRSGDKRIDSAHYTLIVMETSIQFNCSEVEAATG